MRARSVVLSVVPALLLLGAAVLTLLRVAQPAAGWAVRAVSFTPFALPAYAVVLGWLLVWLLPRAAPWRPLPRRALLPLVVVALVGLALHARWLGPSFTQDPATEAVGEPSLTVMTVNVLTGQGDAAAVLRTALEHDVDLLAVQEIEPTTLVALEAAGLNETFPYHAGEAIYGAAGSMLLSRTPITAERPIETQWTSFAADTEVDGRPVTVVVTHPKSPMGDAAGWHRDLGLLREAVARDRPQLVLGDLNATPDHQRFLDLLDVGLRDAAEQAGSGYQPTWPSAGEERVLGVPLPRVLPIDHVLVDGWWTAVETVTESIPGSDHAALVARLAPVVRR